MSQPLSQPITRRDCLAAAVCAAAAIALRSSFASAQAQPKAAETLKVSLNAYSFNKLLNDASTGAGPGVTLIGLLEFCAKYKFDALDATGYYFPGYPARPSDDYVDQLKHKAADVGVAISGTGVRNTFITPDATLRAANVQLIKEWIEVAARLGAPVLRVFTYTAVKGQTWETASRGFTRDQVQDWVVTALKECAAHAHDLGVKIGVQNHADFIRTGSEHLALIKGVDSPSCRAVVDTGSFKTNDPYADIAVVAPDAVNWQIKTSPFGPDSPVATDLPKLIRIVRNSGYRGYLPIETLIPTGKEYDPYELVPKFLNQVRQAIKQTA